MESEKQKDVIAALQKNVKTRGKGLSKPPVLKKNLENIQLDERSEAVPCTPIVTPRSYRVSTYISEESGDLLDNLILQIKRSEGKKPKIAAVLERALLILNKQLENN